MVNPPNCCAVATSVMSPTTCRADNTVFGSVYWTLLISKPSFKTLPMSKRQQLMHPRIMSRMSWM